MICADRRCEASALSASPFSSYPRAASSCHHYNPQLRATQTPDNLRDISKVKASPTCAFRNSPTVGDPAPIPMKMSTRIHTACGHRFLNF